jgi:hypothetical protein
MGSTPPADFQFKPFLKGTLHNKADEKQSNAFTSRGKKIETQM